VSVTTLRFQPTLGTAIDSPLTRYLHQPVVPTQLGYDPLLQFVHAEDAVGALEAVVMRPVRGPVNVAGAGSVSLSRLLRLAGKVPLPIPSPLFSVALGIGGRLGLGRLPPEAVPWLRNGLTLDCTRLEDEVGFRPRSTQEAVEDFVAELRGRRVLPDLRSAAIGSPASRSGRRRNARARTRA
jgi:UDP-glucose 4-epimerase